ncbi:protein of unknown function [Bartonella clarridgeiae 73]|uniref:PTS EIIA type-2 domain-containing protein n=1 Tax=Bartonella clarridgeiae (strain CCUG 45776 / CIP 104772 / 73) TaxID=696125 RepID=E6YFS3_BARC7|nr:MAG: hypothetical protein PG977_001071 [Bartonella clarridgeiae]CBI75711.1 protein of unknown function [Bartonella clarridgeiae 73]
MFLLLIPKHAGSDHLKTLSKIAHALRYPDVIEKLCRTHDANTALYYIDLYYIDSTSHAV